MATTAKGTPYVESSDLVADYPTVSLALAEHIDDFGGKVLQVVRATDTTDRTTTSATFVDASISVTITPQKSTSAIVFIYIVNITNTVSSAASFQITDSANNPVSGAENMSDTISVGGHQNVSTIIGYATPAVITAVTYKVRFNRGGGGTLTLQNSKNTAQLYAIEVSA
jgi:hypothetical protein